MTNQHDQGIHMNIIEEYSIDIRVTSEQGENDYGYPTERYGCDIINTDGELLVGIEPEYKTPFAAVRKALICLTKDNLKNAA